MGSKKRICIALFIVFILCLNVLIIMKVNTDFIGELYNVKLHIVLSADSEDEFQLFYTDTYDMFTPADMKVVHYNPEDETEKELTFTFSPDKRYFRFDPGEKSHIVRIKSVNYTYRKNLFQMKPEDMTAPGRILNVDSVDVDGDEVVLHISSEDPQILLPLDIKGLLDCDKRDNL